MAVATMTVTPYAGPPGTVVDVIAPSFSAVDFTAARGLQVYLQPQALPPGLASSTVFFGYPQTFAIVDAQHLQVTISGLAASALQGLVPGVYGIVIIDALEYVSVGNFQVLKPGQTTLPPPPGAEFINWWIGPYIPNWKPGGYSGFNAPPGWTFWYDSPGHPCTDLAYWWDAANWGTGSWHWMALPIHAPPGWTIVWDNDAIHGANTSLHGWILQPDNPANPAPGVQWPPWPTVAPPPPPPPPPSAPVSVALPPPMPNPPLPAPWVLARAGGGGGAGGGAGRGAVHWPGEKAPSNKSRSEALYFVSDLHLADASPNEDFVEYCLIDPKNVLSDASWARLVNWICNDVKALIGKEVIEGARLVLNGDILDLWGAGETPGQVGPGMSADYEKRLDTVLGAHPAFFAALNQFLGQSTKNKLIYLRGNHDEAMLRFQTPLMDAFVRKLPGYEAQVYKGNDASGDVYVDDGFALIAEHGNAYDDANYDLIDFSTLQPSPPPAPVLMMKGQVFVEEFVNWMEVNGPKVPSQPDTTALISSLLLVDNAESEVDFGIYLNSWALKVPIEVASMWAQAAITVRRSRLLSRAKWTRELATARTDADAVQALADSNEDDNVMLGRGTSSRDQALADDVLDGTRAYPTVAKPLIVGLGHTHEKVWRRVRANKYPQLHFNTNTWSPKYELDRKEMKQIPDSAAEPLHPVVRVVPHPRIPSGPDRTDLYQPGIEVLDDVILDAPPGATPAGAAPWQVRVTYCRLPPPAAPAGAAMAVAAAPFVAANVPTVKIHPRMRRVRESLDSEEFKVEVIGGRPTAYKWTLLPPPNVGNDPAAAGWNVLSGGGTADTVKIAHTRWFAEPDDRRMAATDFTSEYAVMCEVTVGGNRYTANTPGLLEVTLPNPLGATSWPSMVDWTTIVVAQRQVGGATEWYVDGKGNFHRSQPVKTLFVETTSQFFAKITAHEDEHVQQLTQKLPWTGFWDADKFYTGTLSTLTSRVSEADLRKQIADRVNQQNSDDNAACLKTKQDMELGASRADVQVAPHYLEKTDDDVRKQYPRPPY